MSTTINSKCPSFKISFVSYSRIKQRQRSFHSFVRQPRKSPDSLLVCQRQYRGSLSYLINSDRVLPIYNCYNSLSTIPVHRKIPCKESFFLLLFKVNSALSTTTVSYSILCIYGGKLVSVYTCNNSHGVVRIFCYLGRLVLPVFPLLLATGCPYTNEIVPIPFSRFLFTFEDTFCL